MRIIILLILLTGCKNQNSEIRKENLRLKDEVVKHQNRATTLRNEIKVMTNQVDSLKIQLYNCGILLETFED